MNHSLRRRRPLRIETLEDRRVLAAFDVLVFSETTGFRHGSIEEGIAAVQALGAANDFSVTATEDSSVFASPALADYEAVVFMNTTGTPLNPAEQAGFQQYIRNGGGFVGVHAAADTHKNWDWYVDLVGASFVSHPAVQPAEVIVADRTHNSTDEFPERFTLTEEWYNYNRNPRLNGSVQVLATLDESSYNGGTMGFDHPIAWYQYFEGGRSWYTGFGHRDATFALQPIREHLLGGIRFAAGVSPDDQGGGTADAFEKVVLEEDVSNPMSLQVASDGRVFFVELGGRVRAIDPVTQTTSTIATIPVKTGSEDGLLGIALDPNFDSNGWVYLFYTIAGNSRTQHISRFTYDGNVLLPGSEQVLLAVPTDPNCCHTAGSLAFGPNGELFISVGDDTNPFASNGHAPIDERSGRTDYDAQRSSANTNDLRGKILRIVPEADGTYSIPAGNLFPADGSAGRPEIYTMGLRNPFRISVDQENGTLYWGDVGPDAGSDNASRGPRGFDEINRATEAGNYGWPYIIADNRAYVDYDFDTGVAGSPFDPTNLVNDSPNNTGATNLPDAEPAFIWYGYSFSNTDDFPVFDGGNGRTAAAGPVYHFDASLESPNKLPDYFDNTLFVYDWSKRRFWEVKLDSAGDILVINPVFEGLTFTRPIEAELGPDGAVYVIEWGSGFSGNNSDAQIVRVDHVGSLPNLIGDYNSDGVVNAADYGVWRDNLGAIGPNPADGDNDGFVNAADERLWRNNYGAVAAPAVSLAVESFDTMEKDTTLDDAPLQRVRAAWAPTLRSSTVAESSITSGGFDLRIDSTSHDEALLNLLITRTSGEGPSEDRADRPDETRAERPIRARPAELRKAFDAAFGETGL